MKRLTLCLCSVLVLLVLPSLVLAEPVVPADLAARKAEIETIQNEIVQWRDLCGPRINEAIARTDAFLAALGRVQALALTPEERKALAASGVDALPAEKAQVFRDATPVFEDMKACLASYFEAYDRYMTAELNGRCFGQLLAALERYENVRPQLSEKENAKAGKEIAEVLEIEKTLRTALANPEAKNHELTIPSNKLFRKADALDDAMLALERKHGLAPKEKWGVKVGTFLKKVKLAARVTKIWGATIPAGVRMMAYLYNPFRKTPDAEKVTKLLRFYSNSYRWAAGLKLKVVGEERIPANEPVIFALSHRSHVDDGMAMMACLPKPYAFLAAQRAMPAFLNDKLVEEPSIINVGGTKPDGTTVDAIDDSVVAIQSGLDLAIFPEGAVCTMQKETRPLRSGVAVIAEAVDDEPVSIVPVSIDDPAAGFEEPIVKTFAGKQQLTVTFHAPIDPLKFRSVPGSDRRFLLDVIRACWHRDLYRKDVALERSSEKEIGTLTPGQTGNFDRLYEAGQP